MYLTHLANFTQNLKLSSVTVEVVSVNDCPVARDDTAVLDEDTTVTVKVLENDSDADGDALTLLSTTTSTDNGGTVVIDKEAGTITYT